jgi:hypothetical protein
MGYLRNHLATVVCGIFATVLSILWLIMVPEFPVLEFVFIMAVPIMWFIVFACWIAQLSNDYMKKYPHGSHVESHSSGTKQVYVSDAACGCSTAAGHNSECDCEMQGTCFCDGSCECKAHVCQEHSSSMR